MAVRVAFKNGAHPGFISQQLLNFMNVIFQRATGNFQRGIIHDLLLIDGKGNGARLRGRNRLVTGGSAKRPKGAAMLAP